MVLEKDTCVNDVDTDTRQRDLPVKSTSLPYAGPVKLGTPYLDTAKVGEPYVDNVKLGGPYSAFTDTSMDTVRDEKSFQGPFQDSQMYFPVPSRQLLSTTSCFGPHGILPTDFHIAPAFAQIFQRRRRRENRPRRQRTTFTSDQTLKLELEYTRADYITRPRRFELAETLNLTESQIKIWFQNRRAKDKRIEKAHMDHTFRAINYQSMPGAFTSTTSHPGMCGTCAVPIPVHIPIPLPQIPWSSATTRV